MDETVFLMPREGYVEAAMNRARALLSPIPKGSKWADYWLFVALEANKSIARDHQPRPVPAMTPAPACLLDDDFPKLDCLDSAAEMADLFWAGGELGYEL